MTMKEGIREMTYDILIKNGRIVDGSGGPSYRGDVAVKDGKIVEIGKLSGPATRTIDAAGRVVAPGFIDNLCHKAAQSTWDPPCTFPAITARPRSCSAIARCRWRRFGRARRSG